MGHILGKTLQCLVLLACGWSAAHAQQISASRPLKTTDQMTMRQVWREDLIRKGFYHPLAPKPFRLAVPLMNFDNDDRGPKLMLGFAPRLRSVDGRNVVLLFTSIDIE